MDFFRSVFSDEPTTETKPYSTEAIADHPDPSSSSEQPDRNVTATGDDGVWSFGGLLTTLSTKSESMIETYRRDLKEFGSGLREELQVVGGSLKTVGHAIDELGSSVLEGTAQIISHGKDTILAIDEESDLSDDGVANSNARSLDSKPYSRFVVQVRAMQGDPMTYCAEAEDMEDYRKWKSGFVLENREVLERLLTENGAMESVYTKVVPGSIDEETFWYRYFYNVDKLKQAEELRASLVKRAISREDEDLSWDVDDDEESKEEEEGNSGLDGGNSQTIGKGEEDGEGSELKMKISEDEGMVRGKSEEVGDVKEKEEVKGVDKSSNSGNAEGEKLYLVKNKGEDKVMSKSSDENVGDDGGSCKDSNSQFSMVSSRATTPEEEDLEWDDIGDVSSIEEKRGSHSGGSPNKLDLRKRLIATIEEKDLSWDIEDDDEPVKT